MRSWADPQMNSPYPDGQSDHPYQAEAAHTHHAPHVMLPSVEHLHSVKISAYHTNVQKERGHKGEQRGKRVMWVGKRGRGGEEEREGRGEERGEEEEMGKREGGES